MRYELISFILLGRTYLNVYQVRVKKGNGTEIIGHEETISSVMLGNFEADNLGTKNKPAFHNACLRLI